MVRLVLNHSAVVKRKEIQGRTPFYLVSAGGQMKNVKMLSSFRSDSTVMDILYITGRPTDCL